MKRWKRAALGAMLAEALVAAFLDVRPADAEYGDVVINNYSDAAGMRPKVLPQLGESVTEPETPAGAMKW